MKFWCQLFFSLVFFAFLQVSELYAKDYASPKIKELAYKIKDLGKTQDVEGAKAVIKEFHSVKLTDKEMTPDDVIGFLSIVSRSFKTLAPELDREIIEYFNKIENCRGQSVYFQFKANMAITQGALSDAKQYIYSALKYDSICKDTFLQAINYGFLSNVFYYEGNYNEALKLMDRNYDVFLQQNDTIYIVSNLISRGATHKILGHNYTAAELFKSAYHFSEHHSESDISSLGMIQNNIGVIFMEQKHYDLAEKIYIENIQLFKESDKSEIPAWLLLAYMNMAGIGNAQRDKNKFIENIQIADSLVLNFPVYLRTYLPIRFRGNALFKSAGYAIQDLNRLDSIIIAEGNNIDIEYMDSHIFYYKMFNRFIMPKVLWPVLDSLSLQDDDLQLKQSAILCQMYKNKSIGNDSKVAEWALIYADLVPKIDSLNAMALIADMAAQYQLKELTEQIRINEADKLLEAKKARQYLYFMLGLTLLLIILAINLYFIYRNYNRNHLLMQEKDQVNLARTRVLQHENLLLVQKNKHTQVENEFERNKIAYAARLLSQLNTMIESVERLIAGSEHETAAKLRNFKLQLISLRETNLQNDEVLKQNTDLQSDTEVYLRKKLGALMTEMSPAEIQILLLSKEGFQIKDIAAQTGYSVSYVENIRSGLRKKLNVPTEVKLQEYLMNL
jgi:DNA-binding CsgD family transcriptional regulator